jgi:DNA helicase II / ATP-dependent DNA helicase PcrA
MAKEYRVVGPPGSGKTTSTRKRVEKFVADGDYEPEDIILTSFSRAAAKELSGAVAVPRENVATLHSLARRIVGPQPVAEVGALAKQWDEMGVPPAWQIGGHATADEDDGLRQPTGDGTMLSAYSLARSRMLPPGHPAWSTLTAFGDAWEMFKMDTGSVDFTDMIDLALKEGGPAPGEPPVIMVDEAQDLNPLQWALVRHWANHPSVERFFVMGDPAQAVYGFAGARPEEMLTPFPEDQQYVLPRSYRMPRAVKDHAERYLARHSGAIQDGRVYEARDADGAVRRVSASWRDPDLVVQECERLAAEGRSSLILATCTYMLKPAISMMRERSMLYQNQWRRSNAQWNPIGARREGIVRTIDRVAAFARGEHPELWLPMLAARSTYHTNGAKKHLEDNPEDWQQWMRDDARQAAIAMDMHWLRGNLTSEYRAPVAFAANLIARRGVEVLDDPIMIDVGTIHSVKGGQADVVFIFPDISAQGAEEIARGREGKDAAIRMGYVGLSRAREEVVICAPAGREELEL